MAIKVLDDALISKIAAGEVIERPASIIKELVENSIDAGATDIDIDLEDGGKQLIRISDNGCGMNREDAELACVRHATSKISQFKDLFDIKTMGFRGEALSSIAAVSDMSLSTKTKEEISGYFVRYNFGELIDRKVSAANTGTVIIVRKLFELLPARLKFLKDETTELRYIMSILTKIALINPEIAIHVSHNGKTVMTTQKGTLKNTVASVLGSDVVRDMMEVSENDIFGFISKPNLTRADKSNQFIYLNKRPIENKTISDAINDAYHTLLFLERQPVLVLNITLNPNDFDINVHPTKKEVRLEKEKQVYDLVFNAIRETFKKNDLIADFRVSEYQSALLRAKKQEEKYKDRKNTMQKEFENTKEVLANSTNPANFKDRYSGFLQKELDVKQDIKQNFVDKKDSNLKENYDNDETIDEETSHDEVKEKIGEYPLPKDDFFVLGQAHKTYIICETREGLTIYDQHATEERVNYEKIMNKKDNIGLSSKTEGIAKQALLAPLTLHLNPKEMKLVEMRHTDISKIGFDIDIFGTDSIIVRAIPFIFHKMQDAKVVYDIINTFESAKNKTYSELVDSIASTMACRASVKAGDILSRTEMVNLIREYKKCKLPYTCPHGRPGALALSVNELEKLFKRIA